MIISGQAFDFCRNVSNSTSFQIVTSVTSTMADVSSDVSTWPEVLFAIVKQDSNLRQMALPVKVNLLNRPLSRYYTRIFLIYRQYFQTLTNVNTVFATRLKVVLTLTEGRTASLESSVRSKLITPFKVFRHYGMSSFS